MSFYDESLKHQLEELKQNSNYRHFIELSKESDHFPHAITAQEHIPENVMVCCSLDYLGMGHHPKVVSAAIETVKKAGVSSGGSRNLSGTCYQHVELEKELADFHQRDSALVLNSGYLANQVAVSVLGSRFEDCIIFSDELNHASIIEGVRASRSDKVIYKHNDVSDLELKLSAVEHERPKIVIFESIYSMEGDIAPVRELLICAKKYGALTILNEVHAIGIFGEGGRGIANDIESQYQPDLIIGSLSKGIGAFGGYLTGSKTLVDSIRSFGYGLIFTSSLPPSVCAAALASIRHIRSSNEERERLLSNAAFLTQRLNEENLRVMPSDTHIVPVIVGNSKLCNAISKRLLSEFGIYAVAVNFPTVPWGTERLRLVATARHTKEMIEELVAALKICFAEASLGYSEALHSEDLQLGEA
ncbi:5-aminolevulinate synthase [Pseudoalteromonas sp. MMG013]|uniref:5-aminolevulinate synthase n=1 Tax=Pseudoalteromonas sp. MMG013 TaxID=2822687 RepID=UPI001B374F7E|nr:5-aminolevulinate synthase [Pseudoalteromonas sp. MMG013]MBQ4862197.1 5-aminolevulinate synthase [Pseudoalteromonas sp. MMG013]